ncbi:unnamed protein product [Enterobius vermicularis]|uniref:Very long-chain specific acyl-CoA dehydrogenase, mitochondrial n=1 Tax=Enterobius vermicularis TaxID=51028 RepID=A0A0N4UZJ6_ENTVE|nr:unnamed protein product [Enterobius vermicularis]
MVRKVESASFVMNLFCGRAEIKNVIPFPAKLTEERKEMLHMLLPPTEKFLTEINNPVKNDENAEIPMDVLKQFGELGGFGALVPEEYGGAGMNNTQMARLAEVIGANDLAMGVVMGAHQSIGYKGILLFGNDEMKKKYLPDLASGRRFACFCLTEPSSGSDANSIRTRAEKTPDGKHYVINGSKIWISNGAIADVFTVFAQTPVKGPDGTIKDKISAFVVERSFGGVTNGPPEKKMGIKGSNTTEVYFDNTKVPVENLIGKEGEGFKIAMNILNNGRFGIPAACTGAMKTCIIKTIEHVNERTQFGKKLKDFENVKEQLVDMVLRHYATESVLYLLAATMDKGVTDYQLEAAIGKVMASENAWMVCDTAIQLHGGMGYMKECGLERVMRDLRIFRLFEGANDVLRLFISLAGMQVIWILVSKFQALAASGYVLRIRTSIGVDMTTVTDVSLIDGAKQLNGVIKEFGKAVESLLLTHRKEIIGKQWELIRMANAAIDIFTMTAVLARCSKTLASQENSSNEVNMALLLCDQV